MRKTRSKGEIHTPCKKDINKFIREVKKDKVRGKQDATHSRQQQKEASPFIQGPQEEEERILEQQQVEKPQEEAPFSPTVHSQSSKLDSQTRFNSISHSSPSSSHIRKMAQERTLGELLDHQIPQNPGNIVIPNVPNFKLSPSILSVLPIFEGHKNENPYVHLDNLDRKCTALFGNSDNLDNIKLTLFSHTLGEAPRDWLNHLQGGPFTTFREVGTRFLKRYYPSTLTAKLRKEITGIQQDGGETLQEYYERFVRLCASCPNHNLDETSLIDQFLQGMNDLDARLLQCSAGGSFNNMTPSEVRTLIETMAEGNQGRGGRMGQVNMTNTVDLKAMESRITQNFETRFSQMLKAVGAKVETKRCEFCGDASHATDECDRLQEDVHAIGNYPNQRQPFSQTYNESWKKHPNFRWRNDDAQPQFSQSNYQKPNVYVHPNAQAPQQTQAQPQQQPLQPSSSNSQISSLDEKLDKMMALMAGNFTNISTELGTVKNDVHSLTQNQATQGRQMQNLEMQVKQIAGEVNMLKGQGGNRLPSQGTGPMEYKPINQNINCIN